MYFGDGQRRYGRCPLFFSGADCWL